MHKIQLPAEVNEENLFQFLTKLASGEEHSEIVFDFKKMIHYIPSALVAMVSSIQRWKSQKKKIRFKNHKQCNAYKYLVRIDFFEQCGIKNKGLSEKLKAANSIVCIQNVENVPFMAMDIAQTIAPDMKDLNLPEDETGLLDCVEYVIAELGKNIEQHSGGTGVVTAQYFPSTGYVRIAIADNGIGIRESFKQKEVDFSSDIDAVEKALDNKTELSKLNTLASKFDGQFIVVSNQAFVTLDEAKVFDKDRGFKGTLCAFSFKKFETKGFDKTLYNVNR